MSRAGIFPQSWSLDTAGPITARVEDAALMLSIMAGPDELDSLSSNVPGPDYVAATNDGVSEMKIGVPKNYFFDHCHEDVVEAVEEGIDILKGLGCAIVEFELRHIPEIRAASHPRVSRTLRISYSIAR